MRSKVMVGTMVGVWCWLAVGQAAGAAAAGQAPPAGDPGASRYDEPTGLWFTRQVDAAGRVTSEVTGKELSIRKRFAEGRVSVELRVGKRALQVSASPTEVDIRSGSSRLRFDPARATEADYDRAKELLAQSRVVSRLRSAVAGVQGDLLEAPEGFDLLLTDALVGILDGDPRATMRAREGLRRRVIGVGLRPAAAGIIGACYAEYRIEAYNAFVEAEQCLNSFAIWNIPMRNLCNLEWTIRAEAAWFEFVGCSLGRAVRLD
jgi:hypothetical protein